MTERRPDTPDHDGVTPFQDNRAVLLDRVLANHLRRRYAVEQDGPFVEPGSSNLYNREIDEQFLRGEERIVSSLIADLVESGPAGAALAMDVVFDRTVKHAEYVEQFEHARGGDQT